MSIWTCEVLERGYGRSATAMQNPSTVQRVEEQQQYLEADLHHHLGPSHPNRHPYQNEYIYIYIYIYMWTPPMITPAPSYYGLWFVVCGCLLEVFGLWFVVCGFLLEVFGLWFVVCGFLLEVFGLWFVVFS
jgi:hypothetical protein